MNPDESEFLAENEFISIVPNFSQNKIFLITCEVGPFNPGLPLQLPIWLAMTLKQRQRCRIIPPDWMDIEKLEEKKKEEKESKYFTPMPSNFYMEITQLLLRHATDDIPKADEIRTIIKDIWDLRSSKLRNSIDLFFASESMHAKLNHLTLLELNIVRPFFTKSLEQLQILRNSTTKNKDN